MDKENKIVSLETLGGGAVMEKFEEALKEVLENIDDPNTSPEAAREINIKLKIKPNKNFPRELGEYSVQVTTKTAPTKDFGGVLYFATDGGEFVATEKDQKQTNLFELNKKEEANS